MRLGRLPDGEQRSGLTSSAASIPCVLRAAAQHGCRHGGRRSVVKMYLRSRNASLAMLAKIRHARGSFGGRYVSGLCASFICVLFACDVHLKYVGARSLATEQATEPNRMCAG